MKTSLAISWNNSFSVGVKEIDDQHKKLVEILNELISFSSEQSESRSHDINSTIEKIAEYKTVHFETEEKYFKKFNFEKAEEHIQKHREFDQKVEELLSAFQKDSTPDRLIELLDFMEIWFADHMLNMDQEYAECFKKNGFKSLE